MASHVAPEDFGLTLDHMRFTLDAEHQVARLVIDRPGKLNAITMPMRDQIAELFYRLEKDGRARVVILRGAGHEAFTAGGEIAGFMEKEPGPISLLHENVAAPERFPASSSPPWTGTASASASNWPWRATFGSPRRGRSSATPRSAWA